MKKILLILFIFSVTYSQNGVRSLNGSLSGSQRIVWDTTGTPNTFKITTSNGVHTLWFPYNRFALTGQGSVGNADSLGGLPASDYLTWSDTSSAIASKAYSNGRYVQSVSGTSPIVSSGGHTATISFSPSSGSSFDSTRLAYLDKANTFTETPQTMGRAVIDTMVSSGATLNLQNSYTDNVLITGKLTAGNEFSGGTGTNYDASDNTGRYSFMYGKVDSNYSTSTTNAGENFIFGNYNKIDDTYGGYGNWLFGQYINVDTYGMWVLGADDSFQKKRIPFNGSIIFLNETVRHWGENSMSLNDSHVPLYVQSPRISDSVAYAFELQKRGSSVDSLSWGSFNFVAYRNFTQTSGKLQNSYYKTFMSVNLDSTDNIDFNVGKNDPRAWGDMRLLNGNFKVSAGYIGADSLRGSTGTTTYWNHTGYHSELGASYFGNITAGSGTFNGAVTSTGRVSAGSANDFYVGGTALSLNALGQGGTALEFDINPYQNLRIFRTTNNALANFRIMKGDNTSNVTFQVTALTGAVTSGAITSTGLSTFGTNAGNGTIGAGDSVQVTVTGLTSATGVATVCYKRGITSSATADTIATYDITANDKLTLFGKYGWTVSYTIMKK